VAYSRYYPSVLDAGIEETDPRSCRFPFKIEYFLYCHVWGLRVTKITGSRFDECVYWTLLHNYNQLCRYHRKHFFMNILCIQSFCLHKTHNRILLLSSTFLKHDPHFDYWNQPLNMRMCVSHGDCHEAGLCCYLVIHIGNVLSPLQLYYFRLWPIFLTIV
jgi:hypothetical protein